MQLYSKRFNEDVVAIPEDAIICDDEYLDCLKSQKELYPLHYCWEVWIINQIRDNKDGYFDFSKNLVDIGAGLAEYCWLLPFNHSYAFEPNKKTIYKAHANILMHDRVDSIDTIQALLSDCVEDVQYDGFLTDVGSHICYNKDKNTTVKTTTLDSFGIDNIGLIKIDVEGMEEKVLRGGLGTIIRNNYPPILFECWNVGYSGMTQEKHDSLFNFLQSLGYEIIEHWGDFETHLAIHEIMGYIDNNNENN